jgi:subtilisin family serine protease
MTAWRDARRQLFFKSIEIISQGDIGIADRNRDDGNEVLFRKGRLRVSPGADMEAVRGRLVPLGAAQISERLFELHDDTTEDGPVVAAVRELPGDVSPEYVFLAQQRVQPGEDPEQGVSLPKPSKDREQLGRGVRIAVVDTGIGQHAAADLGIDLAQRTSAGTQSPAAVLDPLFDRRTLDEGARRAADAWNLDDAAAMGAKLAWAAGHGTFVASLIRQVAPGATIIPIKACMPAGFDTEESVAAGIDRAVEAGVDIINLSWCTYGIPLDPRVEAQLVDPGSPFAQPLLLRAAVDRAVAAGIVVVAAAGNSASPDPMYPAAWPDVVAVGALDPQGRTWGQSNYGQWVDAYALGENLRGVYVAGTENPDNDPDGHAEVWDDPATNYATWSGTSFSAPLVAAQIAITKAALAHKGCSTVEARDLMLDLAAPAIDAGGGKRIMVDIPGQT